MEKSFAGNIVFLSKSAICRQAEEVGAYQQIFLLYIPSIPRDGSENIIAYQFRV
jgi:hypothetical protein